MMLQACLAALPLLLAFVNTAAPVCGDGVVSPGEACDDGNIVPGDGCGADCGVEAGFSCYGQPSHCNAGCGDGALGEGEQCDDGNSTAGDGCGVHCDIEPGYGCTGFPSVCTVACGDGIKDASEACDDGNTVDGDGCSAACAVEAGFGCPTAPVSAFFTYRGNSECTTVGSLASPILPNTATQALLSTPGRYRVRYVSGAISYYAGSSWLPGVLGVNFTSAAGPVIFSLGANPPSGQPSRVLAMSAGFSVGLKRDVEAVSGPVLVAMVDTDCTSNNNSNTTIVYRVDALSICQQEPVISQAPAGNGPQTFAGEAAPGTTVDVYLDGDATPACTAVASGSGEWTCAIPALAEGPHSAVATVTLLSSTVSSVPVAFLRDTIAPAAPSLITPAQGAIVNAVPEFGGLAEPSSQITVVEDTFILCTAITSASGSWSCMPSQPLVAGPHTVLATAIDVATNSSSPSAWRAFIVDAAAPAAPAVTKPGGGEVLAADTPSVGGTAEPGSVVRVLLDGMATPVCTAVAAGDGSWSCKVGTPLAEGEHMLTATATDAVGNTGPGTLATSFIVDTEAPDTFIPSGPPALVVGEEAEFEFSSNEAGVAYECSLDEGLFTPCVPSYSLAPGPHVLRVRAVDSAGNADPSPAEAQWTVRLPHLAGGGCSAAPLPASWLVLLALAALRGAPIHRRR
ncbi:Ig-like domain-containing protein [Hyalangium versicolor]|uniref:Ig-like domain-containing protein n=1 Tax=Hyalangium versicolor TaxID=2861190 RepID=UPI001CCA47AC|nr:Ig-like domain-containing protein [Hyalangium versicolor]